MYKLRVLEKKDFHKVNECIISSIKLSNSQNYPKKIIDTMIERHLNTEWINKVFFDRYFIVAEKDGIIIGTGALKNNNIYNMFVHPDHQRKKLGLTILLHLEDKARKDEFNHVICDPSITALDFYKKQGYYEVEKKKIEWIGEKILSVRLRKDLGLKKKNRFIC